MGARTHSTSLKLTSLSQFGFSFPMRNQGFYFRVARLRSAVAFLLARFALDAKETSEGLRPEPAIAATAAVHS